MVECDDQAIDDEDLHHESDDDEKNVNADVDYACPSDQDSADESSETSDMDEDGDDAVYRGEEESRLRHMLHFVSQCCKSARESPIKKV